MKVNFNDLIKIWYNIPGFNLFYKLEVFLHTFVVLYIHRELSLDQTSMGLVGLAFWEYSHIVIKLWI